MSYQDPRYRAHQEPYTPHQQQQHYPPTYQQPGYVQSPEWHQYYGQRSARPQKSRKVLAIMVPVCLGLLVLVTGSAYFFFFSGTEPEGVVGEYIEYAQENDFASARSLTTDDASEGARFEGDGDQMEAMRRWFSKDTMEWSIRGNSTSAKYATVTVDKTLDLEFYAQPVEMRWDYDLERDTGSWRITRAEVMTKVESAEPDNCLASFGLAFDVTDCASEPSDADGLWVVTDEVDKASDCPDPKETKAEDSSSNTILCLEKI